MSGLNEEEDYFNDLSQQPQLAHRNSNSNTQEDTSVEQQDSQAGPAPNKSSTSAAAAKRIACVLCRKRKLRCDGNKPSCATCTRLQHDCSYDEVRRKSGPKRGYVKALEARLAQVETLLNKSDEQPAATSNGGAGNVVNGANRANGGIAMERDAMVPEFADPAFNLPLPWEGTHSAPLSYDNPGMTSNGDFLPDETFSWEMIGLGLDEPLPTQDVVEELNNAYFEKIHPSLPMIHKPRYHAAMNLAPHMRPPVCLRYAMWCNASTVTDKFSQLHEHFYHRARNYIQQDEMKGHGESMITISHCQSWILIATYEFKLMYFPRAWMSAGRACRSAQMMGLHRLDGAGLDVKQCLPPPRDYTEREERRRTFWMAFCVDRYSSIGTGWPMVIDERDIMTSLPGDHESFELNKPCVTVSLDEALSMDGAQNLSGYSGVILMACLFGRNLTHLHRPTPGDAEDDLNGDFWRRHRHMDNILLTTALSLPDHLRLPSGLNDANIVFFNMCIHTSTICLHQAALFKADKNRMPARVAAESKVRCITAAAETASIMRQISHMDLSAMNPFISFSLYVAARVFVQYLKSRPQDLQIKTSLTFLLAAMQAVKRKNPLTESFLVQLDVDLEGAGLHDLAESIRKNVTNKLPDLPSRSEGCPVSQMGVGENTMPNYSDFGKQPNVVKDGYVPGSSLSGQQQQTTFAHYNKSFGPDAPTDTGLGYAAGLGQFDLPVRTPAGSGANSGSQSLNPDMDTDGSIGGDGNTPNSSTQSHQNLSTHTSHTGYSPQGLQQSDLGSTMSNPGRMTGPSLFDPNDATFSAQFDINTYTTNEHPNFALPANWANNGASAMFDTPGSGPTGFTPGPAGSSLGNETAGGAMPDMMNLSDVDWNAMIEGMGGFDGNWDTGAERSEQLMQHTFNRRS